MPWIGVAQNFAGGEFWNIGSTGASERSVASFRKWDGQAGCKRSDAGDLPAARDAIGPAAVGMEQPVERQTGTVAANEMMLHFEQAQAAALPRIIGIDGVFKAGGIIQAFSVSVAQKEF